MQVRHPTLITELENPATIQVRWSVEWKRWDSLPYTEAYPDTHTEDEADLLYVPMYSVDGGKNFLDMLTNQPVVPGKIPWKVGVGPDPLRTLTDVNLGADEVFTWNTPAASFPEGTYVVRVEVYRASEALHYSHHQEKIYVNR